MASVGSVLDMGTGGGERLASLAPLPPIACATEAYAPNVPVARRRLTPLGVNVVDTTADPDGISLPFEDGAFELIVTRHECFVASEVFRLLQPGGTFITQQCGGHGEVGLIEWFKGPGTATVMDWTVDIASEQLTQAGFRINHRQEAYSEHCFKDVGAVVYYLRAIRWLVEDFSVERYRDRLYDMHLHIQQHGGFSMKNERFLIEAGKPEDKNSQTLPQ
ncbi:MAG: class I SAM-dependent methyltransferase [Gemmatimonadales bacterium]|nr:MAG: class I SAM-dependent methyltransferase [Gemmatimonadales bacterium]